MSQPTETDRLKAVYTERDQHVDQAGARLIGFSDLFMLPRRQLAFGR